jgi:hypothetical protein
VVEQDLQDLVEQVIHLMLLQIKVMLEVMELQDLIVVEQVVEVEEQLLQDQMEQFQDQHLLLI